MKLLEFGCSGEGTMMALAILLADGNNRGGGDLRCTDPIIGHWAGDRIVIAGDYADFGKWAPAGKTLYTVASEEYKDVSAAVVRAILQDEWLAKKFTASCEGGMHVFVQTLDEAKKLGEFVPEPEPTTVADAPGEREIVRVPKGDDL